MFNRISGTATISEVVDSSFTLIGEQHNSGKARLYCVGRDIEYQEIGLEGNEYNLWEVLANSYEQPELFGDKIISLLKEQRQTPD